MIMVRGAVFACWFYEPKPQEHYFFYLGYNTYNPYYYNDFYMDWKKPQDSIFREENINFWYNYVNKAVSRNSVARAMYSDHKVSVKEAFFAYLDKQNDTTALHYWRTVKDYTFSKWERSLWYYPTKKEVEALKNGSDYGYNALSINTIENCKDKNIRNRYALQLMRRAFAVRNFDLCVEVWKKYARHIPASALRTQCKSYYAGAQYQLGNDAEATQAFFEIGYCVTWYDYSYKPLKKMYDTYPNSKCFEFIVQHLVTQHFDDKFGDWWNYDKASSGTLRRQTEDINRISDEIIADGRSNNPALWRSAQAAFAYIDGDIQQAIKLIKEAESLKGTKNVKDNIRTMRLILYAADTITGDEYENRLVPELEWVAKKLKYYQRKNGYLSFYGSEIEVHYYKVLRRTVLWEILNHFKKTGQHDRCLAYLNMYGNFTGTGTDDCGSDFFGYADTTSIGSIKKHIAFLKSAPQTAADTFLLKYSCKNYNVFNELVGTKYLRLANWNSAIEYLGKVSNNYLKKQSIHWYITTRNPFLEDDITNERQGVFILPEDPAEQYKQNPSKLTFCRIMKNLKRQCSDKDSTIRSYARYAYALGMSQALFGCEWALARYAKGSFADEMYNPAQNDSKKCMALADKAIASATNLELLERCFLLKYMLINQYAYPGNYYSEYDENKMNRYQKMYSRMEEKLLKKWDKAVKTTVSERYLRHNFCDVITDYRSSSCNYK